MKNKKIQKAILQELIGKTEVSEAIICNTLSSRNSKEGWTPSDFRHNLDLLVQRKQVVKKEGREAYFISDEGYSSLSIWRVFLSYIFKNWIAIVALAISVFALFKK